MIARDPNERNRAMSSPSDITIYNYTQSALTTRVTMANEIEEGGNTINGKVVPNCSVGNNSLTARVVANTSHHGTLVVDLINAKNQVAGTFTVKSIKDPQEGEKSLDVVAFSGYVLSMMGYRNSPSDLRRVNVVVAQC
jgi:hypothetical protein